MSGSKLFSPRWLAAVGLAVASLTAGLLGAPGTSAPAAAASANPYWVLAAAGDIACEPYIPENATNPAPLKCGSSDLGNFTAETATAQQAAGLHPDAVALLGDEQYQVGKYLDFQNSFDRTWGPLKALERPTPGNHEYYAYTKHGDNEAAQNGVGYFSYFNGLDGSGSPLTDGIAGPDTGANQGWYSFTRGSWHIISLNIECKSAPFNSDCSTTDGGLLAQETSWLAGDLANDTSKCTLAYWHQPTFSATTSVADAAPNPPTSPLVASAEGAAADAWWKLLYAAHADLVLNGHEHVYARFQPMDPDGNVDQAHGIRQFTIGTGGEDLDSLARNDNHGFANPNATTGEDDAFGVMKFRLGDGTYSWDFHPAAAGPGAPANWAGYQDSGTATCHA